MAFPKDLVDIVLSFDTTGSMYACIGTVKERMNSIMRKLKSDIPGIKLGVIAHGDYDTDHTYVIKYVNLTDDVSRLCGFVREAEDTGGGHAGNLDEAYELSLQYCRRRISWRPGSSRVVVMIGDCRPHEKDYFLNHQHIDWNEEIMYLRNMDVKINAVQCENRTYATSFYRKISSATFGHYVQLHDIKKIEKVIMDICYREAGLGLPSGPEIVAPHIPFPNLESSGKPKEKSTTGFGEEEDEDEKEQLGLICPMCKVGKLPNEFPTCNVTEDCEHPYLVCLRCVIKHVQETETCPHPGCDLPVDPESQTMKLFQAILDRMFVDYAKVLEASRLALRPEGDVISVSQLNGDTEWFPYRANMQIKDLKRELGTRLGLRPEQQKLVFNDVTLKGDGRLIDYNIDRNASISLILPLYCVPEHLDHVVFELSWEFPAVNPDFLDATCMAFSRAEFIQVIDWNHPTDDYYLSGSVRHSEENKTGPGAKTGHQTIHVYLKKVPTEITHLYFTLSSWRSPNLSAFQNPSLKFYDATDDTVNLCETTFAHALNSQAVIMCYAVRRGRFSSEWQIFECGARSLVDGNAKRYNPIRERIAQLIKDEEE